MSRRSSVRSRDEPRIASRQPLDPATPTATPAASSSRRETVEGIVVEFRHC
ncbi:hypothetical protein [Halorussus sp. MSC15.2]|uniref:hypothetical protein n=1 Tax=Halorussus sp. MSC15.2 TaxID=2283638 RepID=UPI0019674B11|nr:hypothetical protein [Halorussus sp. MSC15.2]